MLTLTVHRKASPGRSRTSPCPELRESGTPSHGSKQMKPGLVSVAVPISISSPSVSAASPPSAAPAAPGEVARGELSVPPLSAAATEGGGYPQRTKVCQGSKLSTCLASGSCNDEALAPCSPPTHDSTRTSDGHAAPPSCFNDVDRNPSSTSSLSSLSNVNPSPPSPPLALPSLAAASESVFRGPNTRESDRWLLPEACFGDDASAAGSVTGPRTVSRARLSVRGSPISGSVVASSKVLACPGVWPHSSGISTVSPERSEPGARHSMR